MSILLTAGYKVLCGISGGVKKVWLANFVQNNVYVKDTGDGTGTYSAVADAGGGLIEITADNGSGGHGLQVGLVIALSGGAYDGVYEVKETPTASTFRVEATFTATDTGSYALEPATEVIIGTSQADGTPLTFFFFEQEVEAAEAAETATGSTENGSIFTEQNVSLVLFATKDQAAEAARRKVLNQLLRGRFVAVVEDTNGVKRVYGAENGLKFSEGTNDSGKALGDLAGATLTLQGFEPFESFIYDDSGDSSGTPAEPFDAFVLP